MSTVRSAEIEAAARRIYARQAAALPDQESINASRPWGRDDCPAIFWDGYRADAEAAAGPILDELGEVIRAAINSADRIGSDELGPAEERIHELEKELDEVSRDRETWRAVALRAQRTAEYHCDRAQIAERKQAAAELSLRMGQDLLLSVERDRQTSRERAWLGVLEARFTQLGSQCWRCLVFSAGLLRSRMPSRQQGRSSTRPEGPHTASPRPTDEPDTTRR